MDNSEQLKLVDAETADTIQVPPVSHGSAQQEEGPDEDTAAELAKLGEDFRKTHETVEQCNLRLREGFNQSTTEAIACGRILIQAKGLAGHGGWMKWLEEHARVSASTAQRYMRLAKKSSSVTDLTGRNLTQCYRDLGLLNTTQAQTKKQSAAPRIEDMIRRICNLLLSIKEPQEAYDALQPVLAWAEEYETAQQALKDRGAPEPWIVDLQSKHPLPQAA